MLTQSHFAMPVPPQMHGKVHNLFLVQWEWEEEMEEGEEEHLDGSKQEYKLLLEICERILAIH